MFFEQLENDVKARLQTMMGSGVEVELEPETETANRTPFAKPRVSVMFDQSEFEKQKATGYIAQHETCRLAILIRCRLLRGDNGIYTTVENVRRYIAGYAPPNWSKMWLIKFQFLKRENNLWEYVLTVGSTSMIVEEDAPPTEPLLQSSTATYTDNSMN